MSQPSSQELPFGRLRLEVLLLSKVQVFWCVRGSACETCDGHMICLYYSCGIFLVDSYTATLSRKTIPNQKPRKIRLQTIFPLFLEMFNPFLQKGCHTNHMYHITQRQRWPQWPRALRWASRPSGCCWESNDPGPPSGWCSSDSRSSRQFSTAGGFGTQRATVLQ